MKKKKMKKKKISLRERRRIQKEKEKKEKEEKEKEMINENNKELKKIKGKNLKESENPLNNNNLEDINEDDEYIYDLIDINDEIKKHIKLSKIIENKINYPIKKYFYHWKEITKFEKKIKKLKGNYLNSFINLESNVIKNKNNELNESNGSSSSKNSMDVRKNLKFTIGITLLKKILKKFFCSKLF